MAGEEIELVREAYEAFNSGDPRFSDFLDSEVEWIPGGQVMGMMSGPVHGRDGVEQLLANFREAFEEIRMVPLRIESGAEPGQVVVELDVSTRGRGSGAAVTVRVAHLLELRDGKCVAGKVYPHAQDGFEAAGLAGD